MKELNVREMRAAIGRLDELVDDAGERGIEGKRYL